MKQPDTFVAGGEEKPSLDNGFSQAENLDEKKEQSVSKPEVFEHPEAGRNLDKKLGKKISRAHAKFQVIFDEVEELRQAKEISPEAESSFSDEIERRNRELKKYDYDEADENPVKLLKELKKYIDFLETKKEDLAALPDGLSGLAKADVTLKEKSSDKNSKTIMIEKPKSGEQGEKLGNNTLSGLGDFVKNNGIELKPSPIGAASPPEDLPVEPTGNASSAEKEIFDKSEDKAGVATAGRELLSRDEAKSAKEKTKEQLAEAYFKKLSSNRKEASVVQQEISGLKEDLFNYYQVLFPHEDKKKSWRGMVIDDSREAESLAKENFKKQKEIWLADLEKTINNYSEAFKALAESLNVKKEITAPPEVYSRLNEVQEILGALLEKIPISIKESVKKEYILNDEKDKKKSHLTVGAVAEKLKADYGLQSSEQEKTKKAAQTAKQRLPVLAERTELSAEQSDALAKIEQGKSDLRDYFRSAKTAGQRKPGESKDIEEQLKEAFVLAYPEMTEANRKLQINNLIKWAKKEAKIEDEALVDSGALLEKEPVVADQAKKEIAKADQLEIDEVRGRKIRPRPAGKSRIIVGDDFSSARTKSEQEKFKKIREEMEKEKEDKKLFDSIQEKISKEELLTAPEAKFLSDYLIRKKEEAVEAERRRAASIKAKEALLVPRAPERTEEKDFKKIKPAGEPEKEEIEENKEKELARLGTEVTLYKITDYKELWAQTEQEGEEIFKQKTRELWKEFAVHNVIGKNKDGKPAMYTDLDGKCSLGLLKLAGIKIGNVEYIPAGEHIEGRINLDTGKRHGVVFEDRTGTVFIDHHADDSGRDSSTTKFTYELLVSLGLLKREPYLDELAEFVTQLDNKTFSDEEKYFKDSWRTVLGLDQFLEFKNLADYLKSGGKPTDILSEKDIKKIGGKRLFDKSQEQKGKVESSLAELERMEKSGLIVLSERYGKIAVDIEKKVQVGFDAAKAVGCGAYIIWSPQENSFFISSVESLDETFRQGQKVRDNMWIKPRKDGVILTMILGRDVLLPMTDGQFTPTGELAEFIKKEEQISLGEKLLKEYKIENLEQLLKLEKFLNNEN